MMTVFRRRKCAGMIRENKKLPGNITEKVPTAITAIAGDPTVSAFFFHLEAWPKAG